MISTKSVLIALGANEGGAFGGPLASLVEAKRRLARAGARVVAFSGWWRSAAFPPGSGPDFVNAVARVEGPATPEALLATLHAVEAALGRVREARWSPRVADLDLLCWGARVSPDRETAARWLALDADAARTLAPDRLILPHPRLHERAFVLGPMAAVAPEWRHPLLDKTVAELYAALSPAARAEAWPDPDLDRAAAADGDGSL